MVNTMNDKTKSGKPEMKRFQVTRTHHSEVVLLVDAIDERSADEEVSNLLDSIEPWEYEKYSSVDDTSTVALAAESAPNYKIKVGDVYKSDSSGATYKVITVIAFMDNPVGGALRVELADVDGEGSLWEIGGNIFARYRLVEAKGADNALNIGR